MPLTSGWTAAREQIEAACLDTAWRSTGRRLVLRGADSLLTFLLQLTHLGSAVKSRSGVAARSFSLRCTAWFPRQPAFAGTKRFARTGRPDHRHRRESRRDGARLCSGRPAPSSGTPGIESVRYGNRLRLWTSRSEGPAAAARVGATAESLKADSFADPLLNYVVVTGTIADMGDKLPSVSIACTP